MRKVSIRALTVAAAVMPFLVAVPAAQAQGSQICGNTGSGYCINAWNGGPNVKMYYGGYGNDDFQTIPVYACSGQDTVQATTYNGEKTNCPFTDVTFDQNLAGDSLVEVYYENNGKCVADNGGEGSLGACGNVYGSGAANGTIDVLVYCGGGWNIVNRYETNQAGNELQYWQSGGNPGTPLYLNGTGGTCWGGSGLP